MDAAMTLSSRTGSDRRRILRASLAAAAAAALLAGCGRGVPWADLSLGEALQRAQAERRIVMLDVHATWCAPCLQLEKEVWSSRRGGAIAAPLIAVKVDFDAPNGQEVKRRYRVLSLPTVLFLRADGTEVDRIEGYEERDAFLEQARGFARGEGRLEGALAARKADPADPVAALRLGHLLLVRGVEPEGVSLLREAARLDPDDGAGAASEALFVLGRYYSRAVDRPADGIPVWKELHARYRESGFGQGALYWVLRSCEEAGQPGAGPAWLEEPGVLAGPNDYAQAVTWFIESDDRQRAAAMLEYARARFPEDEELPGLAKEIEEAAR